MRCPSSMGAACPTPQVEGPDLCEKPPMYNQTSGLPHLPAILLSPNMIINSPMPCLLALQFRPPPMKHAGPKPKERYDDD